MVACYVMYPPGLIAHYVSRTPADQEIFHRYLDCFILVDARDRSGAKAVAGISITRCCIGSGTRSTLQEAKISSSRYNSSTRRSRCCLNALKLIVSV
jgi:hypothetical protein